MAFRSTVHCLCSLFGSDVSSSQIWVFILSRYSLYFLFIFTSKEECVVMYFYTEWRKDPLTLEATQ